MFASLFNFISTPTAAPVHVKPQRQILEAEQTMTNVYDVNGVVKKLEPRLAKGGEGEIFPLAERQTVLVKRYFDSQLTKEKAYLEEKVETMRLLRNEVAGLNISWPAICVFNEHKQWIGYAMPKVEGHTMRTLAHAMLYKKHAPNLNRRDIATMMLSWLNTIKKLHAMNVMIGDYNLSNFMWDPKTLNVGFIDCDSYQIKHRGKTYRCLVGSPDLTAPEQHGRSFKQIERTLESEYFSIAIILFMCFMLGRHPYDIVGGEDPVKNLQHGNFAYGKGKNGKQTIPKGDWYKIWSHMSYSMKSLFVQTFTDGVYEPGQRATIDQWINVLQQYRKEIDKGYHSLEMRPAEVKSPTHKSVQHAIQH